jgi:hypothetical protein
MVKEKSPGYGRGRKRHLAPMSRNITPDGLPSFVIVYEERSAGAASDGVDFRTRKVTATIPLSDRFNEMSPVECDIDLDTGEIYTGMSRNTGYAIALEDLQTARDAVGRTQLSQEDLDELERKRQSRGYKRTEIGLPIIRIPTRNIQTQTSTRRGGLLGRLMNHLSQS